MTLKEKNKGLAIQHWQYIAGLMDVMLTVEDYEKAEVISMCKFQYLTAWEHGAKHYAELLDGRGEKQNGDWILSKEHVESLLAGGLD
ncbi:MAG: hypothetical protein HQK65_10635 [Desulfamplus sp.]|nr:hypothetical protein [Desulfamplus sp.]